MSSKKRSCPFGLSSCTNYHQQLKLQKYYNLLEKDRRDSIMPDNFRIFKKLLAAASVISFFHLSFLSFSRSFSNFFRFGLLRVLISELVWRRDLPFLLYPLLFLSSIFPTLGLKLLIIQYIVFCHITNRFLSSGLI